MHCGGVMVVTLWRWVITAVTFVTLIQDLNGGYPLAVGHQATDCTPRTGDLYSALWRAAGEVVCWFVGCCTQMGTCIEVRVCDWWYCINSRASTVHNEH